MNSPETIGRVDKLLSEMLIEISLIEGDREEEILKEGKPLKMADYYPEAMTWSSIELSNLIRGVFKLGENEWSELLEEIDLHPSRTPN